MVSQSSRCRQQQMAILERGERAAITCDRCIGEDKEQCLFTPTHLNRYQKCYSCVKVGQSCRVDGVVAKKYWKTFDFKFQPATNTQKGKNKRILIEDSPEPTPPKRPKKTSARRASIEPEPNDDSLDEPPGIPTTPPADIWGQLEGLVSLSESSEGEDPEFGMRIDFLEENNKIMKDNIAELKQEKEEMSRRTGQVEEEISELKQEKEETSRRMEQMEEEVSELKQVKEEMSRRMEEEIAELKQEKGEMSERMEQMEEEIPELEKEKEEMAARMKKIEEQFGEMEKKMLVLAKKLLKK